MQLFSADATTFKKKTQKNCPKKLLIIPLDQEFLVQEVFGSVELRQFYSLIFEVVKLCRMKKYLKIYKMQVHTIAFHYTILCPLYSGYMGHPVFKESPSFTTDIMPYSFLFNISTLFFSRFQSTKTQLNKEELYVTVQMNN